MNHYIAVHLREHQYTPVENVQLPCFVGTIVHINKNHEQRFTKPKDNLCNWKVTNVNIAINQFQMTKITYRACRYIDGKARGAQCDFSSEELGKSVFIYDLNAKEAFASKCREYEVSQVINYYHQTLGETYQGIIKTPITLLHIKCLVDERIVDGIYFHLNDDKQGFEDCATVSCGILPKSNKQAHDIINSATWYKATVNDLGYYILGEEVENSICDRYEDTQPKE